MDRKDPSSKSASTNPGLTRPGKTPLLENETAYNMMRGVYVRAYVLVCGKAGNRESSENTSEVA
jgi:hypothetical protein